MYAIYPDFGFYTRIETIIAFASQIIHHWAVFSSLLLLFSCCLPVTPNEWNTCVKHVYFERSKLAKFNSRKAGKGESKESFHVSLLSLNVIYTYQTFELHSHSRKMELCLLHVENKALAIVVTIYNCHGGYIVEIHTKKIFRRKIVYKLGEIVSIHIQNRVYLALLQTFKVKVEEYGSNVISFLFV